MIQSPSIARSLQMFLAQVPMTLNQKTCEIDVAVLLRT